MLPTWGTRFWRVSPVRETSVGLGVVQVIFTIFFVALLVWLALGVGIAALIGWGIFHLITTLRGRAPSVKSAAPAPYAAPYSTPAPNVAQSAPSIVHPAPPSPATPPRYGAPPVPPPPAYLRLPAAPPPPAAPERERTNWPGLASVVMLSLAGIPFLLGNISWAGVAAAAGAALVALVGWTREPSTAPSRIAMLAAALIGVSIVVIGAVSMWTNTPTTLFGTSWGDNRGEMTSIAQLQEKLPCIDASDIPADEQQGFYSVDVDLFEATASCHLHDGDDSLLVVFVQAHSAEELERIFGSGAIVVDRSKGNDLWVERDGAVAVITADEESGDLAQDVGTTWISLDEQGPDK